MDARLVLGRFIKILNPLGEDLAVMRTSLIPSAVRAACYNMNRKNNEGRLFELAKVYNAKELPLSELPIENEILSMVVFGENEDFFTLKGVVEGILDNFCNGKKVSFIPSKNIFLHPTRCADIVIEGITVGYLGQIHPNIIEKLDCDKPVYGCEIFYNELSKFFNEKILFKPISKFPTVERDLAVIIDAKVPCSAIIDIIESEGGQYLDNVKLFDIYQGEQVGEGKKSMAFNLIFVSYDKTLNVEEIDSVIKNILSALSEKLNAQLR